MPRNIKKIKHIFKDFIFNDIIVIESSSYLIRISQSRALHKRCKNKQGIPRAIYILMPSLLAVL